MHACPDLGPDHLKLRKVAENELCFRVTLALTHTFSVLLKHQSCRLGPSPKPKADVGTTSLPLGKDPPGMNVYTDAAVLHT